MKNILTIAFVGLAISGLMLGCKNLSSKTTENNGTTETKKKTFLADGEETYPDPEPDKKAEQMPVKQFIEELNTAGKTDTEKMAKLNGKVVEISGRVTIFKKFDGKELFFSSPIKGPNGANYLGIKLQFGQDEKLVGLLERERLRAKCVVGGKYSVELENCIILERRESVLLDEKPDTSVTAQEFYDEVGSFAGDYKAEEKANEKYSDKYMYKVVEISGKVYPVSSRKNQIRINKKPGTSMDWVSCDTDVTTKFDSLTDGQEVKFRAVYDGISLKDCLISK